MLYAVCFLGSLGVVPLVHGAYKVSCDAADSLKRHLLELVIEVGVFAVNVDVESFELSVIFVFQIVYISRLLFKRGVSCDSYR